MEALFDARCIDKKLVFTNSADLEKYCIQHSSEEIIVQLKLAARVGPKMRLYAFYHGPLLEVAMIGYTYAGYEGIDKVKADYLLRAEFAKDFIKRPDGTYVPIMMDKHKMSQPRLFKFVQDCVFFIERDLQQTIPDSEEYKISKNAGRNYKRVQTEKPEGPQFMPPDESLI